MEAVFKDLFDNWFSMSQPSDYAPARTPSPAQERNFTGFFDFAELCIREHVHMAAKKTNITRIEACALSGIRGQLRPIGVIRSTLKIRSNAPRQGSEGAPDAWLEVQTFAAQALEGLVVGDEIIVLTWLHQARRDVLKVRPRSDRRRRLTGVFATRSPDRPNPLGLHRVTVREIANNRLRIGPIEAIDGTPVVDIKPVLSSIKDF